MPDMQVEFEVICECGHGLCGNTRTSIRRGMPQVLVEPCPKCLENEYDKGKEEGYREGSEP